MSQLYNTLPSTLLGIRDDYTAFCFNEACAYIMCEIREDKVPNFKKFETREKTKGRTYRSFKDFYDSVR